MRNCSHVIIFLQDGRYTAERNCHYTILLPLSGIWSINSYTDMLKKIYLGQAAEENFVHIC
jgi:hypothetical protein